MTRHTVLIVDDSYPLGDSLRDLLVDQGYEVTLALDGEDAIARARAESPEVIVLDLRMPRVDGWEFLRLREHDASLAHVPVVIFSAFALPGPQLHP